MNTVPIHRLGLQLASAILLLAAALAIRPASAGEPDLPNGTTEKSAIADGVKISCKLAEEIQQLVQRLCYRSVV